MFKELKWNRVSNGKLQEYKDFVNLFFEFYNNDLCHFRCMIVDNTKVNHKKHNDGDKEKGFYKFYYQLLLHCFGLIEYKFNDTKFYVFLDERKTNYNINDLKKFLNSTLWSKSSKKTVDIAPWGTGFKTIEAVNSKKSDIIQINDIILGAVGYHKNEKDLIDGASDAKRKIANYISDKLGFKRLGKHSTIKGGNKFKIWNFSLK